MVEGTGKNHYHPGAPLPSVLTPHVCHIPAPKLTNSLDGGVDRPGSLVLHQATLLIVLTKQVCRAPAPAETKSEREFVSGAEDGGVTV